MSGNFKGLIYVISVCAVLVLSVMFFIRILPWLIAICAGVYLFVKVKAFIQEKKSKNKKNIDNNINYDLNTDLYDKNNSYSGDVIDVDYEEVGGDEK